MFQKTINSFIKYMQSFYKQVIISVIVIILLFTTIGMITTTKPSSRLSASIFSSWTSNVDQSVFSLLFSMENRGFDLIHGVTSDTPTFIETVFNVATSIKLDDLKSVLGQEIPGFSTYENKIIVAGEGLDGSIGLSHESGPPLEDVLEDKKAIDDSVTEEKTPKSHPYTT